MIIINDNIDAGPEKAGRRISADYAPLLSANPAVKAHADLWSLLPASLAELFRPEVHDIANDVLHEIQQTIPDYARSMQSEFGRMVTTRVQEAIRQFVERLGDPSGYQDRIHIFHHLGRHEMYQGRDVHVLQTAYRVGAQVAWRRMAAVGIEARVPTRLLCLVAEAIFAYIEELSAISIDGYAAAQALAAGTIEPRRRKLMDMMLTQPAVPRQRLVEQAKAAHWPIPDRIVAVALKPLNEDAETPALDDSVLMDLEGSTACLILPEPEEHRRWELEAALSVGWRAAVGVPTSPDQATFSLRSACAALEHVATGLLPDSAVIWCDRHLTELFLHTDMFLAGELAGSVLAPLQKASGKQRARLSETLFAWLHARGNIADVAEELKVHPQTVRARMRELEKLFGDRLHDPQTRFEMMLALRSGNNPR